MLLHQPDQKPAGQLLGSALQVTPPHLLWGAIGPESLSNTGSSLRAELDLYDFMTLHLSLGPSPVLGHSRPVTNVCRRVNESLKDLHVSMSCDFILTWSTRLPRDASRPSEPLHCPQGASETKGSGHVGHGAGGGNEPRAASFHKGFLQQRGRGAPCLPPIGEPPGPNNNTHT